MTGEEGSMFRKKSAVAVILLALMLTFFTGVLAEEMKAITLADDGSSAGADGVLVEGNVIRIKKAGDYLISGSLANGQIVVSGEPDSKVGLFLNNVSLHNETGPAISIEGGLKRVTVSLVEGTENNLSNGENLIFTEGDKEPSGVIFSRSDLTITGTGRLSVQAGALDGISSRDDLRLIGCSVSVTAPRHAIRGKDYVQVTSASLNLRAGKDGLRSTADDREDRGYLEITDSTVEIACGDDAFYYITRLTVVNSSLNCSVLSEGF